MKKLITKEQKNEIVNLAQSDRGDAVRAFGSIRWNQGYNLGVLVTGLSCLAMAGVCYAYDWLRLRD